MGFKPINTDGKVYVYRCSGCGAIESYSTPLKPGWDRCTGSTGAYGCGWSMVLDDVRDAKFTPTDK